MKHVAHTCCSRASRRLDIAAASDGETLPAREVTAVGGYDGAPDCGTALKHTLFGGGGGGGQKFFKPDATVEAAFPFTILPA